MARRRATPARIPSEVVWRLLRAALILAAALAIVLGGVGAFLTYRVVTTVNDTETVTPESSLQSNYITLSFKDRKGGEHDGWLLLGRKGAPAIILCHGYDSNRSELLALGSFLSKNNFNVYLFNFDGPRAKQGYSDLGIREAEDLLAAIEMVTRHPGVNPHRVGLFGTTSGGYAALVAAEQSPLVKALVADTIYEDPSQMLEAQVDDLLGGSSRFFRMVPRAGFHLLTWGRARPPVRANLSKLENMPKLFINSRDWPLLAAATEDLYALAPQPKSMLMLEHTYTTLASGAMKKVYEQRVVEFFSESLFRRAD